MTDDHPKPASDGGVCMIFRRNRGVMGLICRVMGHWYERGHCARCQDADPFRYSQ